MWSAAVVIEGLTLCMLGNFAHFFVVCGFFFLTFSKKSFQEYHQCVDTISVSNSLNPDQARPIQIRPYVLSGLIWVQTVCKGYQQTTKVATSGERINIWLIFGKCKCHCAGLGGSVGCAVRLETRRSRVQPPPRSATFFRGDWSWNIFYGHSLPSADSRRAVVKFLAKECAQYWLTA